MLSSGSKNLLSSSSRRIILTHAIGRAANRWKPETFRSFISELSEDPWTSEWIGAKPLLYPSEIPCEVCHSSSSALCVGIVGLCPPFRVPSRQDDTLDLFLHALSGNLQEQEFMMSPASTAVHVDMNGGVAPGVRSFPAQQWFHIPENDNWCSRIIRHPIAKFSMG